MTKILLVEDDKSLREIYGVRLLAEGYDIISAGDGEEALAMAIKDRPALIVSDVMMPKISGFDMLDILRSTTETRDIKVIMMTALSSDDQRARGEQLGADRYLVKSQVGIEDVVRTVHEVLGDAPTTAGAASFSSAPTPRSAAPAVPERPGSSPAPVSEPTTAPQPQPQPTEGLPRPTAPFSTDRPVGFGVGDRVINPLPKAESTGPDLGSQIDNELANDQPSPQPVEEPQLPELPTPPTPPADPPAPEVQPVEATSSAEQPVQVTPEPQAPAAAPEVEPQVATPAPANPFVTPEQAPPAPVEASPAPVPAPEPQAAQSNELGFEETPRTVSPNGPSNPFAAS